MRRNFQGSGASNAGTPHDEPSAPEAGPLFRSAAAADRGERQVARDGEVLRVTYENDETGFRVVKVSPDSGGPEREASPPPGRGRREASSDGETWVGVFPAAPPGTRVRATGRYVRDPKHGPQFRVDTLLVVAPSTLEGLERYLGSGVASGIGPAYAKRIVQAFGTSTLEVLDNAPERLRDVPGLGSRRADAVAKAWTQHRAVGAIMIFLQAHGASPALATRIYKRFGPRALDIVSRSPYRLALDVWGVGFKTADRIARSIGVGPDAPERAQAGVLHTLYELTQRGHVFAERTDLCARAALMLERDEAAVDDAVGALAAGARVSVEILGDGSSAVYPVELREAEVRVARRLAALITSGAAPNDPSGRRDALAQRVPAVIASFEKRTGVHLADAQRAAIEAAARHSVMVVTGGPGVGKTTIVRALLALFASTGLSVRLAAPTGRAAKRMSEATGREATTLHRLLEFDPNERAFARRRANPIDADVVVVDETSMIDLPLADALADAVRTGTRLLLVGDMDQLPSVGPGAVLRDVIASDIVPTVRLTQIFRQADASLIVENAHRIHRGEKPESGSGDHADFYVIERTSGEEAAATIEELVTNRIPRRFGFDPKRDIQVLTPMHRGAAGAIALNELLQAKMNPVGPTVTKGTRTLRVGDKVMQLRNDYDKDVYNGDIGFVTSVDAEERRLEVSFDGRTVAYEETELEELTLAYATSIHKSQGSEYPAVVVPVLTQHFVMLSRNLIYTAVTRGRKLVVLVADPRALGLALAETRKEERLTYLAERLRAAHARSSTPIEV